MSMFGTRRTLGASSIKARAFSLIELLVALAISAFLVGGAILIFTSGQSSNADLNQLSRIQENVRFASDLLIRDIRNAGYRDRAGLEVVAADEIDSNFAAVTQDENGNDVLSIQYAGRGSCSEDFAENTFGIVTNSYRINADGDLTCQGGGGVEETLVEGLSSLEFDLICPNAADNTCTCDASDLSLLPSACIGVRITMGFDGLDGNPRTVELVAAFRNVILARMNMLSDLEV